MAANPEEEPYELNSEEEAEQELIDSIGREPVEPSNAAWDVDKAAAARFATTLKGRFGSRVESESRGGTVMHLAAGAGACNSLTELLRAGGDFSLVDSYHRTPIFYAAKGGHTNAARILLEGACEEGDGFAGLTRPYPAAGAKVDAADNNGLTPLMAASAMGHLDVVTLLLDAGASLTCASGEGYTAVHAAAQGGHSAVVKLLAERGAGLERSTTDSGQTPLHIAARFGSTAAALNLLALGARPGARAGSGGRVLHVACEEGQPGVLKALLARPELAADLDKADALGRTPLHAAVVAGGRACFELVLEAHRAEGAAAQVDVPTLPATKSTRSPSAAVAGKTALHLAAERGLGGMAASLLAAGANGAARDAAGRLPLHYAAAYGHVALLAPLAAAAEAAGEGCDAEDEEGRTALHLAAKRGCARTAEALVSLGARADAAAVDGSTPRSVAKKEHFEKSRLAACLAQGRLLLAPPSATSA